MPRSSAITTGKRDPAAVPLSRNDAWLCNAGGDIELNKQY